MRERDRERESVGVCVSVCVFVSVRVCVCVSVCVWERKRECVGPDVKNVTLHVFDGLSPEVRAYLTQSIFQVVLQKSIPTQICQFVLYICDCKGQVDVFVGGVTSAKRLGNHFV